MDSPRLTRSISYPTNNVSRDIKEGDPYYALTDSISFGRYMTESLSWEKYSSFSHNRYLEEAARSSKPGSVAQMKAYFEAHFKKRAAKKTQALCEEVEEAIISPESKIPTSYETHTDSYVNADVAVEESRVGINEQLEKKTLDNICESNSIDENVDLEIREVQSGEPVTDQDISVVESPVCISEPQENAYKRVQEEKTPVKEISKMEKLTSSLKKRLRNSLSKSSTSKLKPPMFPPKISTFESDRHRSSVTPRLKKTGGDSNGVLDVKKSGGTSNIKKSGENLDSKKRLLSKSLHMSINFGSHANPESKTTLAKDSSTSSQIQTRVSAHGMSKHSPKIFPSENKRTKTPVSESVPDRVKTDCKQKTINLVPLKSPRGSKPPSPIKCSPFSFMTDERAAKRKEFHQKLQEKKTQAKESEKVTKPQPPLLGRKISRPPHMPSVDTETSKHTIQKNNQRMTHSVASLPRKSTRENFSPNIQR